MEIDFTAKNDDNEKEKETVQSIDKQREETASSDE